MPSRVRFEKHPSRIIFDPTTSDFVVTWTTCRLTEEQRLASVQDIRSWIPSISAVSTLFDRGCIPQNRIVYAAKAIGRAWAEGDRECLDTCEAKKAAELLSDLSSMCVDPNSPAVARDIWQAMRHLVDEMSIVRFSNTPIEEFSEDLVMPSLQKAISECLEVPSFLTWPPQSMRRRLMFCLNRRERSMVKYTLVSLLFDTGSCPLLSLADKRSIRMQSAKLYGGLDLDSMCMFCKHALSIMRGMKESGESRLNTRLTPQQLADYVSGCSSPTRY